MTIDWKELYLDHIEQLQNRYAEALESCGFDAIVIHSGAEKVRYLDNKVYPFWAHTHFRQWVAGAPNTHSLVVIRPGQKPVLGWYQPRDYWHAPAQIPQDYWVDSFDIEEIRTPDQLKNLLPEGDIKVAALAEDEALLNSWGVEDVNPEALMAQLDWFRAYKTQYEVETIREANMIAAKAHCAAEKAFRNGDTELQILLKYLQAADHRECELPFPATVVLNERASTLHCSGYKRVPDEEICSFLIDAGTTYRHYVADITRTYAARPGIFADLVARMDKELLEIIDTLKPGVCYTDVHEGMHRRIASMLSDFCIVKGTVEEIFEKKYTHTFFPHGLGHFIGINCHDVAGWQLNKEGDSTGQHPVYPFLRLQRVLEPGMMFTVEPGLYFIETLLEEQEGNDDFNWKLIDELRPYGGIRIEDNILITEDGYENLTRPAFAALEE